MPLDAFVAFLQREGKLHPVCRSNLAIHGILATVNLVVYLAMIPTIESERFSCHTGTSKTASLVQEECFEYYKRDITKNFPLFALILVTVLPVMVLSVLNCTNFKESSEGSNSYGHRWCKISVFYVGALSLRFLILATFVVLQWSYFYPIWFPDAYNCFIPLASQPPISGLNYTTLTNGTVSNCKDKLSDKKSAVSILVFTAHCLALLLTLVEIVILGRKAHAQAGESESFWDNKTFCEVFLGLQVHQSSGGTPSENDIEENSLHHQRERERGSLMPSESGSFHGAGTSQQQQGDLQSLSLLAGGQDSRDNDGTPSERPVRPSQTVERADAPRQQPRVITGQRSLRVNLPVEQGIRDKEAARTPTENSNKDVPPSQDTCEDDQQNMRIRRIVREENEVEERGASAFAKENENLMKEQNLSLAFHKMFSQEKKGFIEEVKRDLRTEIESLKKQVRQFQREREEHLKATEGLRADLRALEIKNTELTEENSNLRQLLTQQRGDEERDKNLQRQMDSLRKQVEILKRGGKEKTQLIRSIEQENHFLQEENARLQQEKAEAEERASALAKENENLMKGYIQERGDKEEVSRELEHCKEERDDLGKELYDTQVGILTKDEEAKSARQNEKSKRE